MTKREHDLHCKAIVEKMEQYASGDYFIYDGDLYPVDGDNFNEIDGCFYGLDDDGYYYYNMPDDEKIFDGDIEIVNLYDFFTECYNTNYILDSSKELIAVRVMIACGGPNIYIDTWDKEVKLCWWNERGSWSLPDYICESINEIFEIEF